MTVDLWMLFCAVALAFVQLFIAAAAGARQTTMPAHVGNRDVLPPRTGFAGRADRAHKNIMETLPLFAALVLIAHVSGSANAQTALAAQIFLGARLVHAGCYLAGIAYLRSAAWVVSVVAMGMIAAAFF